MCYNAPVWYSNVPPESHNNGSNMFPKALQWIYINKGNAKLVKLPVHTDEGVTITSCQCHCVWWQICTCDNNFRFLILLVRIIVFGRLKCSPFEIRKLLWASLVVTVLKRQLLKFTDMRRTPIKKLGIVHYFWNHVRRLSLYSRLTSTNAWSLLFTVSGNVKCEWMNELPLHRLFRHERSCHSPLFITNVKGVVWLMSWRVFRVSIYFHLVF